MNVGKYVLWTPGRDWRRDANANELRDDGWLLVVNKDQDPILDAWTAVLKRAVAVGHDWVLLATDDSVTYDHTYEHIRPALRHSPSPILSMCHFARAGQLAAARGFAYGVEGLWGIVVAFRADIIESLIEFRYEVKRAVRDYPHTDGVTLLYARRHGIELAYTSRALFDHAMEWGSLLGHHGPLEQRKPLLTVEDDGPPWDAPGVYRHKMYVGKPTQRLAAALAA